MRDPKRLSRDGLAGALLSSAATDAPRASARARTASALGLGVAAAGAVTVAAGGTAKALGASIAPKALGAGQGIGAKAATALWIKLFAAGALTAAVAGGAAAVARQPSNHLDATAVDRDQAKRAPVAIGAREPLPALVTSPPVEPAIEAPVPPATSAVPELPEVARSVPRAAPIAAAKSSAPTESPLARELRSLDDARSALGRGDASAALAALDRHDRAFPAGSLGTEARLLRVEALLARGDRAGARRLAAELLARDPSGPYARRLRTIAESAP